MVQEENAAAVSVKGGGWTLHEDDFKYRPLRSRCSELFWHAEFVEVGENSEDVVVLRDISRGELIDMQACEWCE